MEMMVRGRKLPPTSEEKMANPKKYWDSISEGALRWRKTDICHIEKKRPNMKKNREDKLRGERCST
jgi:hypothetical protein